MRNSRSDRLRGRNCFNRALARAEKIRDTVGVKRPGGGSDVVNINDPVYNSSHARIVLSEDKG